MYPGVGVKRPESGHVDVSPAGYAAIQDDPYNHSMAFGHARVDMIRPDLEDQIEHVYLCTACRSSLVSPR